MVYNNNYLNQLYKLREKTRAAMLGADYHKVSELQFVEEKIKEKILEVKMFLNNQKTISQI